MENEEREHKIAILKLGVIKMRRIFRYSENLTAILFIGGILAWIWFGWYYGWRMGLTGIVIGTLSNLIEGAYMDAINAELRKLRPERKMSKFQQRMQERQKEMRDKVGRGDVI